MIDIRASAVNDERKRMRHERKKNNTSSAGLAEATGTDDSVVAEDVDEASKCKYRQINPPMTS